MSKSKTLTLETGMLAFTRSIQITEGLFFATRQKLGGETVEMPIEIFEKGVRGQSSEDCAKNPGLSNPQSVEFAIMPSGFERACLKFSLRVYPLSLKPSSCDNKDVVSTYEAITEAYSAVGGYRRLAELYVWNLLNARFAWRNRLQSDDMLVTLDFEGKRLVCDPIPLSLEKPASIEEMAASLVKGTIEDLEALIDGFERGLSSETFEVSVVWDAALSAGQEIFPSQEFVREERVQKFLGRILAKIPTYEGDRLVQQASMHSQKIGAALRTIDIWHGNENYSALPVNPYGGVQETGEVLRPKKISFYDLRKSPEAMMAALEAASGSSDISGDIHFFVANLVRGGVFGAKNKNKEQAK